MDRHRLLQDHSVNFRKALGLACIFHHRAPPGPLKFPERQASVAQKTPVWLSRGRELTFRRYQCRLDRKPRLAHPWMKPL